VLNKPLAAIDIGTNTFRLLIAKVQFDPKTNSYNIKEIHSERIITRLGRGFSENDLIKEEAIRKGISVLKEFSKIITHHKVYKTVAVATGVLRDAKNSDEFIRKVKEKTGLEIKIISAKEEAEKTALGILIGLNPPESALMVDIGGGSTELIFARDGKPSLVRSLNLGVVYLADKHMKSDPPEDKELTQMAEEISKEIDLEVRRFKKLFSENTVFIGTAGTVTTLAAMSQNLKRFEHRKIHNTRLNIEKINEIFSIISSIPAKERVKYHPFEPSRLDIIVPGTLILLKLMYAFGFKEVIVSNYGLREGVLLDLYRELRDESQIEKNNK
jgi:exopolyphosphatase/guanosine-5'-triphosphate,3'-diphosphate pyrophosphatase